MTNSEHIRSCMTDEEIADWYLRNAMCPCVAIRDGCALNDDTCRQAWIEWVREEVVV